MKYSNLNTFPAIDYFRLISAILIVAIHTAPLESISTAGNFWITHFVARFGVPFFFVCNGFFLYQRNTIKMKTGIIKKFVRLYIIWTLVYLPMSVYSIMTSGRILYSTVAYIRNIVFVGSYVHLWYMVSAIIAISMLILLSKKFSYTTIGIIAIVLYLLGTLYDEFYTPLEQVFQLPIVNQLLSAYLYVFDTTRTGFFFGFVFVWMGAFIAKKKSLPKKRPCILGFICCVCLMIIEAVLLLNYIAWDYLEVYFGNMYIFLVPAVYFLFCWLIQVYQTQQLTTQRIRFLSSTIFFLHPMMIFLFNRMKELFNIGLFENSLVKYLFVLIWTIALGGACTSYRRSMPA